MTRTRSKNEINETEHRNGTENGGESMVETLHCDGCKREIHVGAIPVEEGAERVYLCECTDLDPKPVRTTIVLPRRWDFQ